MRECTRACTRVHNVIQTAGAIFRPDAWPGLLLPSPRFIGPSRIYHCNVCAGPGLSRRPGPCSRAFVVYLVAFGSSDAEEDDKEEEEEKEETREKEKSGRVARARRGARATYEDMHLSTILVPVFCWAPYGISRPVDFAATTATASARRQGGRKRGGKVRARDAGSARDRMWAAVYQLEDDTSTSGAECIL